jgi:hypothetical protein
MRRALLTRMIAAWNGWLSSTSAPETQTSSVESDFFLAFKVLDLPQERLEGPGS